MKQGKVCCDSFVKPMQFWFEVLEKRQVGKDLSKRCAHGQSRNFFGGKLKVER